MGLFIPSFMLASLALGKFHITMTSWWARQRLKSPASRLFTQPFIQTQIKENIKAPRHWPLCGNSPVTGEFPAQMVSNVSNVIMIFPNYIIVPVPMM